MPPGTRRLTGKSPSEVEDVQDVIETGLAGAADVFSTLNRNRTETIPSMPDYDYSPKAKKATDWSYLRRGYIEQFEDRYDYDAGDKRSSIQHHLQLKERLAGVRQELLADNTLGSLSWFSPTVLQAAPRLVLNILNKYDQRTAKQYADFLNKIIPWESARSAVAGAPSALTAARWYANARGLTEAKAVLGSRFSRLPEYQAEMILTTFKDPARYAKLITYDYADASAFAMEYELAHGGEYLDEFGAPRMEKYQPPAGLPDGTPAPPTQVSAAYLAGLDLYNEQHSVGPVTIAEWEAAWAAFEKTFPEITFKDMKDDPETKAVEDTYRLVEFESSEAGVDLKVAFRQLFFMGEDGFFRAQVGAGLSGFEAFALDPVGALKRQGQDVGAIVTQTGGAVLEAGAIPFKPLMAAYQGAINWASAQGTKAAFALEGEIALPEDIREYQQAGIAYNPLNAFAAVTDTLADYPARLFAEKGSPSYERAQMTLSGVIQFFILKRAGEFGRASAAARSLLPEYAVQELRIGEGVRGATAGSVTSRIGGGLGEALRSPYLHPFRALDYAIRKATFELQHQPIEIAATKNPILVDFFDRVETIKQAGGKVGDAAFHFGSDVPMDLLKTLLETSRRDMGTAFVDYIRSGGEGITKMESLAKTIKSVEKALVPTTSVTEGVHLLPAKELVKHLEHPERTIVNPDGTMIGRTAEQVDFTFQSLRREGYNPDAADFRLGTEPTVDPVTGEVIKVGNIIAEYYPESNQMIIREGHHRIGISAYLDYELPVEVVFKEGRAKTALGADIAEVTAEVSPLMRELSAIGGAEAYIVRDLAVQDSLRARFSGMSRGEADALALEKFGLEQELGAMLKEGSTVPIFKYPKVDHLRAVAFHPVSRMELLMSRLYSPLRKTHLLESLVDDMPQQVTIWNPNSSNAPLNWAEDNAVNVRNYLSRTGVPMDEAAALLTKLHEIKGGTPQAFFDWTKEVGDTIRRHLPKDTPAEIVTALTRPFRNAMESRTNFLMDEKIYAGDGTASVDGRAVVSKIDPRDQTSTPIPQPSRPTDFVGHLHLPDVDIAIEATSMLRRMARSSKKGKWAYETLRGASRIGTAVWKAPILGLRIPAVIARIQFEQALRSRLYGNYTALTFTPGGVPMPWKMLAKAADKMGMKLKAVDPRYKPFTPPSEMSLGSLYEQLVGTEYSEFRFPKSTAEYTLGQITPPRELFVGWSDEIRQLHSDWFTRSYIRDGLDPNAMLKRIKERKFTEEEMRYFDEQQLPVLREAWPGLSDDALLQRWLERSADATRSITRSSPDLLHAAATGKVGGTLKLGEGAVDPVTGQPLQEVYQNLVEQQIAIRDNLSGLAKQRSKLTVDEVNTQRVLQQELMDIRAELLTMRKTAKEKKLGVVEGGKSVDSKYGISSWLHQEFKAGRIDMPAKIVMKKRYAPEEQTGVREGLSQMRRGWDKGWYSLYRPMSWADVRFTRGSTYYQASARHYAALKALGYSDDAARAFGQMHGAKLTRDLMYDLSSRTSAQRAVKDLMWFAPATQELWSTWLLKIPRQYGSVPAGLGLMAGKGLAMLDILRGLGIIQENAEGEDIIMVPGIAGFVNSITGTDLLDTASIRLSSLNLALGGPAPGLSVLPSAAIGTASRMFGGPFRTFAHALEASGMLFSEDARAIPAQITYAIEAITGVQLKLEFLSPQYAKAAYDRRMDVALQYAFADLQKQKIVPPRPEQFDVDGDGVLTSTEEDAFHDAGLVYTHRLMGEARTYFSTLSFWGLIGSTVAPGSISVSGSERNQWLEFWKTVLMEDDGKSGFSEVQQKMIDDYLSDHPNSLAYSVFYSTATDQVEPGVFPTDLEEDNWFQAFWDGQRRYFTAEEMSDRLQATASYRHYTGVLNTDLQKIGGPDLDPAALLRNGYERVQALTRFVSDWDRYKELSGVEETLESTQKTWADQNYMPVRTYEVERLALTLTTLKKLAPYFSTEGGNRIGDYRLVLGELKHLYAEEAVFGPPRTESERVMKAYFDTVFSPWADRIFPMYDRAREISQAGGNASAVYEEIRQINDKYTAAGVKINGKEMPTPEEAVFGNKNPAEREYFRISSTTKPVLWLSEFQLDIAGYQEFEGRSEMLGRMREFDAYYEQMLVDRDVSAGSNYADVLERWRHDNLASIASEYGDEGTALFTLSEQMPVARLSATGWGEGNASFEWARDSAAEIVSRLQAAELSPKGFSGLATYYKTWFYTELRSRMVEDDDFRQLMDDVSFSIPDKGDTQRTDAALFEALFFGNFYSSGIPPELVSIGV